MKVIIAGGRDFNDYELLKNTCDTMLFGKTGIEIVSGGANGADKLGECYANEKGFALSIMKPDYKSHFVKVAPLLRNEEMAKYADALIAFWNGKSTGTKDMISRAKKYNLITFIEKY